jgi:hypothetical protein
LADQLVVKMVQVGIVRMAVLERLVHMRTRVRLGSIMAIEHGQ